MRGLKTIDDPAVLNFLLTEDLYAIKDAAATGTDATDSDSTETDATAGKAETSLAGAAEAPPASEPGPAPEAKPENEAGQTDETKTAAPEVFHYLGENRKFILTLVNYPEEKYLPLAEREYLEKIFSSVQVTLEDIALLNYARYPGTSYSALRDFFAFDHLLLFGVKPIELRIPGPVLPYHLGLVEGVKILAADSAEVLRPDNEKKKALWLELKRIFSK